MSVVEESEALHEEARGLVRGYLSGHDITPEKIAFSTKLLQFQFRNCPPYRRLCEFHGVSLRELSLSTAPAVPVDAFKRIRLAVHAESFDIRTFRTSGTTVGDRGLHAFRSTKTYEEAAWAFGARALFTQVHKPKLCVLGPSPDVANDSSLMFMAALFAARLGQSVEESFFVQGERIDFDRLDQTLRTANARNESVALLGASFSYVHLMDDLCGKKLPLAEGSFAIQTGGFKGRSREVGRDELVSLMATTFNLPTNRIVSEYGMTELSSQFYEWNLVDVGDMASVYREPPWAWIVPVDPQTLSPVAYGEVGIARIIDLMNIDSACIVLAQDRVRRVKNGFELLGRFPGAPPRGCSIGLDELLSKESG